ncbi:sugar transferase [Desulfovibrio inopinatus]|uniref:sugar transferase n=1 Tax=Desulfovibrio inopinatus TaxID=102109 RepID=UPI00041A88A3|nr:sugar transferase [Desulfovibrio inopinatus]
MYKQQVNIIMTMLILVEACIVIFSGYLAAYVRWVASGYSWTIDSALLIGIILFILFTNNFMFGFLGLYDDTRAPSMLSVFKRVTQSIVVDFAMLSMALFTLKLKDTSRLFLVYYGAILIITLTSNRLVFEQSLSRIRKSFGSRKVLLVGSGRRLTTVCNALENQKSLGHEIIGTLSIQPQDESCISGIPRLGALEDLNNLITRRSIDEVVFALPPESNISLSQYMELCEQVGISYRIVPAMYDPGAPWRLDVESVQRIPTLTRHVVRINPAGLFLKRCIDFFIGFIGLFLLAVMFPFVALAIKLDSKGPIFFKQIRVGQNGRHFAIYKFRTMYIDAEARKKELLAQNEMNGCMFKMEKDPRITRVGHFLRKTSLDEFPQFLNVIKGEMSLVGTRPPTLDEVDRYELWHRRRISMKPGITGLWQVSGRNKITDFNDVVSLDLKYIDQWTLVNDLKIIAQTIVVVLARKGAK